MSNERIDRLMPKFMFHVMKLLCILVYNSILREEHESSVLASATLDKQKEVLSNAQAFKNELGEF